MCATTGVMVMVPEVFIVKSRGVAWRGKGGWGFRHTPKWSHAALMMQAFKGLMSHVPGILLES